MSQQSDQAKAFVHPYAPEPEIKIKDPTEATKTAKVVDDYMNNETEEIDLEEALTSL